MLEKINMFLNIIMCSCIGTLLGHGAYIFWDYKKHPDLYAMQSAPWYTSILFYGVATLVVLIVAGAVKGIIRHRQKKE